jgi:hypothetical protein
LKQDPDNKGKYSYHDTNSSLKDKCAEKKGKNNHSLSKNEECKKENLKLTTDTKKLDCVKDSNLNNRPKIIIHRDVKKQSIVLDKKCPSQYIDGIRPTNSMLYLIFDSFSYTIKLITSRKSIIIDEKKNSGPKFCTIVSDKRFGGTTGHSFMPTSSVAVTLAKGSFNTETTSNNCY